MTGLAILTEFILNTHKRTAGRGSGAQYSRHGLREFRAKVGVAQCVGME